jgi:D-alanine-D-alanine ligase
VGRGGSPPGIVVLYNESMQLNKGEPRDMLAENGVIACAAAISEALEPHYEVVRVPIHTDVELAMAPYPASKWVVFNLGEGIDGRLFEIARIAWALEAMGYCYTGASGEAIARTTHKALTKSILAKHKLPTPAGWLMRDATDIGANEGYQFPLIVKPVAEDASLGIGPKAIVHDLGTLKERVDYIVNCYRQAAVVEQFIAGREFNISIWGEPPEVLPLYEIDFSDFEDPYDRIVSFAAKWEPDTFDYNHTPGICPARVSPELGERITETALGAWYAMDCRGYARIDIRVDENEDPYVVEVNCNPDLSPDAGFYRSTRTAGYTYQNMVIKILQLAIKQYGCFFD